MPDPIRPPGVSNPPAGATSPANANPPTGLPANSAANSPGDGAEINRTNPRNNPTPEARILAEQSTASKTKAKSLAETGPQRLTRDQFARMLKLDPALTQEQLETFENSLFPPTGNPTPNNQEEHLKQIADQFFGGNFKKVKAAYDEPVPGYESATTLTSEFARELRSMDPSLESITGEQVASAIAKGVIIAKLHNPTEKNANSILGIAAANLGVNPEKLNAAIERAIAQTHKTTEVSERAQAILQMIGQSVDPGLGRAIADQFLSHGIAADESQTNFLKTVYSSAAKTLGDALPGEALPRLLPAAQLAWKEGIDIPENLVDKIHEAIGGKISKEDIVTLLRLEALEKKNNPGFPSFTLLEAQLGLPKGTLAAAVADPQPGAAGEPQQSTTPSGIPWNFSGNQLVPLPQYLLNFVNSLGTGAPGGPAGGAAGLPDLINRLGGQVTPEMLHAIQNMYEQTKNLAIQQQQIQAAKYMLEIHLNNLMTGRAMEASMIDNVNAQWNLMFGVGNKIWKRNSETAQGLTQARDSVTEGWIKTLGGG